MVTCLPPSVHVVFNSHETRGIPQFFCKRSRRNQESKGDIGRRTCISSRVTKQIFLATATGLEESRFNNGWKGWWKLRNPFRTKDERVNGGYKSCLQRGRQFFCKFVYLRPCKDTYKPVLRKHDRAGIGMRRKSFRFRRTDRRIRKDRFVASHLKLYTYVSIIREIIFSRRKKLNMINEKKINGEKSRFKVVTSS